MPIIAKLDTSLAVRKIPDKATQGKREFILSRGLKGYSLSSRRQGSRRDQLLTLYPQPERREGWTFVLNESSLF